MIICGAPRSGTTLLWQLMAGSVTNVKVDTKRERKRLDQEFDEKGNPLIIKGPHLLMLRPDKPIILIRDPRDVLTSMMDGKYFCHLTRCEGARIGKDHGVTQFAMAAQRYITHNRIGLIVPYESLIRDPDYWQIRCSQFWGLEYSRLWHEYPDNWADLSRWRRKLNGIRPIGQQVHTWKDHLPRIADCVAEQPGMLQEVLELLGYEEDDSWQEILEGRQHQTEARGAMVSVSVGGTELEV